MAGETRTFADGRRRFTAEEIATIKRGYRSALEAGQLDAFAEAMGRKKSSVKEKASALGLGDRAAAARLAGQRAKEKCTGVPKWNSKPHPRGMAGKRHSQATKDALSMSSSAYRASLSPKQSADIATKMVKTRISRFGRITQNVERGTWKAGWREIADRRHYFRSRWEANYARYLQWLKERGDILDWEYEPQTFWFEGIRRGVRSYLPDFRVHELNGAKPFHEVKGWMDARSKTTLKRMAKYHPQETIILIREKQYRALSRFSALIPGWE